MASPFQTKLATNLIASRQFVFFASVKHCSFNVSACSPERKQDVEKNFEDLQGLTDELVVVVVQLFLRVPAVAIVGGVRHHTDDLLYLILTTFLLTDELL